VRFAPDGHKTAETDELPAAAGFDLSSDQCTIVFAAYTAIGRYDICRGVPVDAIPVSVHISGGLLIGPDGGYLTSGFHFSPAGEIIGTYPRHDYYYGDKALSADGWSAFIVGPGVLFRYDLRTRNAVAVGGPWQIGDAANLTVYGGWTAARGVSAYATDPKVSGIVFAGGSVFIQGIGFLPGVIVTIGGVVVPVQLTGDGFLQFTWNPAFNGDIVITNPNGQQVTAPALAAIPVLSPLSLLALFITFTGTALLALRK
jgi:hypothetical protein